MDEDIFNRVVRVLEAPCGDVLKAHLLNKLADVNINVAMVRLPHGDLEKAFAEAKAAKEKEERGNQLRLSMQEDNRKFEVAKPKDIIRVLDPEQDARNKALVNGVKCEPKAPSSPPSPVIAAKPPAVAPTVFGETVDVKEIGLMLGVSASTAAAYASTKGFTRVSRGRYLIADVEKYMKRFDE